MNDLDSSLQQEIASLEDTIRQMQQRHRHGQDLTGLAENMSLLVAHEHQLASCFAANLAAFAEYFPDVHAVIQRHQPQRYHIDLIDGIVNIRDVRSHELLYDVHPFLLAIQQYQDFVIAPNAAELAIQLNPHNPQGYLHSDYLNRMVEVHQDVLNGRGQAMLPEVVPELILFGIGLGYPLELLAFNHRIKNLYLFEPDLDIFLASLFTCRWDTLLRQLDEQGTTLHLCLGIDARSFFDSYMDKLLHRGRYNVSKTFGFVHYLSPQIELALDEYRARLIEITNGWGFFDDGMLAVANQGVNLERQYPFVKVTATKNRALMNVPVFICANGPSLDKHADFIRNNQPNAVIISCGSGLKALCGHGITPDLHCEQERTRVTLDVLSRVGDDALLNTLPLACPGIVHPDVTEKFARVLQVPKQNEPSTLALMSYQGFVEAGHPPADNVSPTVANTALYMATALGFSQIYLFGVDLGYRDEGPHHSKKSMYYDASGQDEQLFWVEKTHLLDGNFGGQFYANDFFNLSRICLQRLLEERPDVRCFNCSDGVMIHGALPCDANTLAFSPLADKTRLFQQVLDSHADIPDDPALLAHYLRQTDAERLEAFCEALLKQTRQPVASRAEADQLLDRIYDEFYLHPEQENWVTLALLEGSVTYFQSVLKRILFDADSEQQALTHFARGIAIYQQFIEQIPGYYRQGYRQTDNITLNSLLGR
ncbi:6-hydroxymethylpterin diphosphokinase MptE-like protein [Gallaecimonas sp. GXIMD1310]|uniref:6-hydroxymethylpterin diphosphokinase MptE-like protein n=1 Tax=Gallaecimonas sp. GXIMD1310 TaxID=3131926 RepID=UPI00324961D4